MKTLIQLLVIALLSIVNCSVSAHAELDFIKLGLPYADVKSSLIEQGWKPIKNNRIRNSSLYAQDVFEQGMQEVVDCISMELDACTFRFSQGRQVLEIKTITRQLNVDSYRYYKSS